MHIKIASLSSAILDCLSNPGPLGVIHSVFDRAVNIKLDNTQRIIALTFSQAGGLPYAMMLAEGQLNSFMKEGIETKQKVNLIQNRCLAIEGIDIIFDYSESSLWSPGMSHLTDPGDIGTFLELLTWSSDYVFKHANHAGLVPLLENHHLLFDGKLILDDHPDLRIARLAIPVIGDLITALKQNDDKTVVSSTIRLLGYGIGGTPSGDDLLVGLLAAMHRSHHPLADQYLLLLSDALKEQLTDGVTSLLSLTVLRHALTGEYSEKIHEVTRQLMHPESPDGLKASLERLLMHGATSGSEMFLGICLGFQLVYADQAPGF
ncbi:MAG: DUF2877 domain-containing protein [Anaerolineaceae bacterium]